ncbi:MAG: hypothetical protein QOE43_745 [Gaiellaceae bacterium]|jgi:hypothetical protein|nr:hypothetical protein [Gaiellaceae bacterium]
MTGRTKAGFALTLTALGFAGAAAAAPSSSGAQRITATFLTIGRSDKPTHVIATGPISGSGEATQTEKQTKAGQVNFVTLHLDKGTVHIVAKEPRFGWKLNARTCTGSAYGGGTFTITGGTGAYKGANGNGTFSTSGTALAQRSTKGECRGDHTPQADTVFFIEITMKGIASTR